MTRFGPAAVAAALALQLAAPASAAAQNGTDEEAERAAAIARADAIRDTLTQPPGDRGFTDEDLVRVPFRLMGAALTVVALPPLAAYALLTRTGIDEKARSIKADLEDADIHLRPDFIGSRSWPALVVRYEGLDPFFVEGGASLRGYTLARAGLALGDTLRGAEVAGTYHNLRELHTWGVGMDAPPDARSDFALTRRVAGAEAWTPLTPHVRLGVTAAWEEDDVDRGFDDARTDLQDRPFRDELYGLAETTTYWHGGASLDLDWTESPALQVHGFRALGRYDVFRGTAGTDSDFQRYQADLRAYLPFTGRHLLALRGLVEDHVAEEGDGVPFHRLGELGDDDGLRGYTSRRFRDRAVLAATAEWRYEVWFHPGDEQYRLEGFAFVDHGGVGAALDDIDGFETTPGLGLRFIHQGLSVAEVYAAWGGEDSPRIDFALGTTF